MNRKLLYICILALTISCNDMALVISDASEIQFWATGTNSFNLEQMGFTDDYCFHQKFLCSGTRRFQGHEVTNDNDYYLLGFNQAGEEIYNEQFLKTVNSLYMQSLIDGVDDDFAPDGSSHQPWTVGVTTPNISIASPSGASAYFLLKIYGAEASTNYNFDFSILRGISGTGTITIYVVDQDYYNSGGVGSPLASYALSGTSGTFEESGTFAYTGTADVPAYIMVDVFNVTGTTSAQINELSLQEQTSDSLVFVHSLSMIPSDESMCDSFVTFKIFDGPDPETDTEIYYTDAVEFVSAWTNSSYDGRVDIQYKSIQNFADIIYTEDSEYFQIQLVGRFRKERKQTVQKSLELTEMVLNTAASVKKQRKLTIDDLPDYMHTKVALILAHAASGSVLVDGMEISVEESYEEGDRPETYPLTPAENWLTIKDYYKHNVI